MRGQYLAVIGENEGFLATGNKLQADEKGIIKEIILHIARPPMSLFVEAILTSKEYDKIIKDDELLHVSFCLEDVAQKIKIGNTRKGISKLFQRVLGVYRSYPFYFNLESTQQISKYIPLSPEFYLDSYYVCLPDKKDSLKEKLISYPAIKDIRDLCYAIMPNSGCEAGSPLEIISNSIAESEFTKLANIMFKDPSIRLMLENERTKFLKENLFTRIPVCNNPRSKI